MKTTNVTLIEGRKFRNGFRSNQLNSMCASLTYLGGSAKSWRLAVVWWVNNTAAATQQINTRHIKEHSTVTQKPITCTLLLAR